jgi:hypothetical protein
VLPGQLFVVLCLSIDACLGKWQTGLCHGARVIGALLMWASLWCRKNPAMPVFLAGKQEHGAGIHAG